jgi:hypothetical protein
MPRVVMLLVSSVMLAATSGSRVTLPRGISFVLPAGWHVTSARVNGVRDPVTVFTATSFRLRNKHPAPGLCSRTLQEQRRVDGASVHLTLERDGASRRRMLPRTPGRPRHFRLDANGAGGLCTPPNSGELTFSRAWTRVLRLLWIWSARVDGDAREGDAAPRQPPHRATAALIGHPATTQHPTERRNVRQAGARHRLCRTSNKQRQLRAGSECPAITHP